MIMAYKHSQRLFFFLRRRNHLNNTRFGGLCSNSMLFYCTEHSSADLDRLPVEWYETAFRKIKKLSCSLKNVDSIDGRLVNVGDDSTIIDERIEQRMHFFKSLVRIFIGSPMAQRRIGQHQGCFRNASEREPMVVDSLTKVSDFLNVSSQQRKLVRHTICPQVTQHHIWTGALEYLLKELKTELLDSLAHQPPNEAIKMGEQIVSSCLNFLNDATTNSNAHVTSWMRPAPSQAVVDPSKSPKWEDMLEMFADLTDTLKDETSLHHHVAKLEVMKEGLAQIKDVLVDKSIEYKEARHQESLVKKKLSKTLGHSSRCLFTLLLYYLYGNFRNFEVDICGGVLKKVGENDGFLLFMGRILSCDEEKVVWNGVRQLDRAMGVFKFVWETAGMKGELEVQGHLFCVGVEDRELSYKGNVYLLHEINL